MGMSTKTIPFFVDTIRIKVEECSNINHFNKVVSIKRFAKGSPVYLEQVVETGEYICRKVNGEFIKGVEA